jgi:tetratricopeptide (TPR) repeat protein
LYRFVLAAFLAVVATARAQQPEPGQLDASPALFTVMAALNAAGYDAEVASPNNHPLRNAIRAELAKRTIPSLAALKEFFDSHRKRTSAEDLSQYISFAVSAQGPPNFEIKARDVEIPPDVSPLHGLSTLLAAFYREGDLEDLWKRSQRAIDQYIARYHTPVMDAVTQINAYLRQQTSGFRGRHFQVFIELQAPPNIVQTRSYGNEYTIVITPSPEPRIFEVRHAYLHYLLDPMSTRAQEILERKKGIAEHAMRAPALADNFKQDFLQLTTESLIKAVEARLDREPEKVQESFLEGYILTPYFAEKLPVYEKQESSMQVYYPVLAGGIDLVKEDARLTGVQFSKEPAPARTVKAAAQPTAPAPAPATGAAKTLADAEDFYGKRSADAANLERAKQLYLQVLQETDQKPLHASAYYGLARIAALERDPETADRLFRKTLELDPEPQVKAWAMVYLGKLALAAGDREQAAKQFQNALGVEGASKMAQQEAQQGLQQSSKP